MRVRVRVRGRVRVRVSNKINVAFHVSIFVLSLTLVNKSNKCGFFYQVLSYNDGGSFELHYRVSWPGV